MKDEAEATIIIGQHYEPSERDKGKILYYYKLAVVLFRQANEKERLATTLVDLADLQQIDFDDLGALKNLREALNIYKRIGFTRLTNVYDLMGKVLLQLGDREDALRYELLAERSALALKDSTLQMSTVYLRISECYSSLVNYKKAISYSDKALVIANKYRDSVYMFVTTYAQANIYYLAHEPKKSILLMNKIYGWLNPKIPDDLLAAIPINNTYLKAYVDLKDYRTAKIYLDKLPSYTTHKNEANLILEGHLYYLLATQQYQACYPYLEANKQITQSPRMLRAAVKNELFWFRADSASGKYFNAIKHYQLNRRLSDSLFTLTKNRQVAFLQIEFETEQKEQNIALQAKSIQLLSNNARLEKQQQNEKLRVLAGAFIITLILFGVGYSRYRLKQRTNLQLEAKQFEIHQANVSLQNLVTEKEWLLKEIHHRVKNNLQITMSLLSVQTHTTTSKIARDALMNSQRRLHSMSLIHQKLYQSEKLAYIEMSAYIKEMVAYLKDSFDHTNHIAFKTEAEKLELDVAQAVPLGLILNEAITNAIKHAFPDNREGEITIKLFTDDEGFYHLIIADNGIGLTNNSSIIKESSLGMELFKILTKQIDGKLCIDSKNGTTIIVRFRALKLFQ